MNIMAMWKRRRRKRRRGMIVLMIDTLEMNSEEVVNL